MREQGECPDRRNMRDNNSLIVTAIKWFLIIGVVFTMGNRLLNPEVTDVTNLTRAGKSTIEQTLGVSMEPSPDMVKKIYEYTTGKITVDGSKKGVAVVYIDGEQKGFHIDNKKYGMYGVEIGELMINLEDVLTYEYDENFDVLNDLYQGVSTGEFFCNTERNDCLIVTYNDHSSRVVALTYYSDMKKITEELSGV